MEVQIPLEILIEEFSLVKVVFLSKPTQPVRGHYKSTNPIYSKLLVVDKVMENVKLMDQMQCILLNIPFYLY
jgi:hypothetical protein